MAGVTCMRHCPISSVELTTTQYVNTECPATSAQFPTTTLCPTVHQVETVTACPRTSPTQQAQSNSAIDNSQQTVTTIIITGLAAIFGTATVTLAVW